MVDKGSVGEGVGHDMGDGVGNKGGGVSHDVVGQGSVVGNGVGGGGGVLGNSLVAHVGDESSLVGGGVGGGLQPAVGQGDGEGSGHVS